MCGIAGFNLSKSEKSLDSRVLAGALLKQIEERGRHATGIAYLNGDKFSVRKAPVPASKFLTRLIDMNPDTTNAILHTRWATKGSPEVNANNHPIISGKIVGVHNGHLSNDDAVFDYLGSERRGQVDSEAAFALLSATKYHPTQVLDSLEGRAALAWLDTRNRESLFLARCCDSPLAIGQTRQGSLIFASTMKHLMIAAKKAGLAFSWADEVEEYTYLRVRNGVIHECLEIGESLKQIA